MNRDELTFSRVDCHKHGLQKVVWVFGGDVLCSECQKEWERQRVKEGD